jgi:hypothetical protein
MTIPIHWLHLYEKPAIGSKFINRLSVYNYRHSINAIGGFDTASCDIALRSVSEMQQFLDQYIGNRVAFYVDNPVEPVWEGFINRMTFSAGGVQYTIGLDEMANRVRTISTQTAGSTTTTQGAVTNDTNSQALYGIKQEQVDIGFMPSGTGVTLIRDTILAQRAWPKTSILPSGGGGGLLHIECLGFYHVLEWEDYRQGTAGSVQLGNFLDTVIGSSINNTTFFDNTDLTDTDANTNTIDQGTVKGEGMWEVLLKIAEMGDGANYWVLGVTPTLFSTGTRRFYYQQANSTIVYTARQSDGLRIRNLYGQFVDPWRVRPDAGIRVSDMLIGWNGIGDNPTETYIKKIDYDANRQSCIYSGDDDLTAEGVFNLKRFNKARLLGVGKAERRLA